jgi:hypothetical protein
MSGKINLCKLKCEHPELWDACLLRARNDLADYDDGSPDQVIPRAELEFKLRLSVQRGEPIPPEYEQFVRRFSKCT